MGEISKYFQKFVACICNTCI